MHKEVTDSAQRRRISALGLLVDRGIEHPAHASEADWHDVRPPGGIYRREMRDAMAEEEGDPVVGQLAHKAPNSAIDFVMAPDVVQDDLFFGDLQGEGQFGSRSSR